MNRMLHCIGDSHVSILRGVLGVGKYYSGVHDELDSFKYIRTYNIYGFLAYNVGNYKHKSWRICHDVVNKHVNCDDIILFSFGEIDCRNHIIKQSHLKNVSIEETVKKCVDRYWTFIEYFIYKYTVIIYGPVPSSNRPYFNVNKEQDKVYPFYGTSKERNYATKLFNDYLRYLCGKYNVGFVTLFYKLIHPSGDKCKPGFHEDRVHIGQKAMPALQKEFKKNKIAAEVSFERK